jgi:hypothetical protein
MKVNVDLKKGIICIIIIKTKFLLFMPLVCFVPKTFELFGSAYLPHQNTDIECVL